MENIVRLPLLSFMCMNTVLLDGLGWGATISSRVYKASYYHLARILLEDLGSIRSLVSQAEISSVSRFVSIKDRTAHIQAFLCMLHTPVSVPSLL